VARRAHRIVERFAMSAIKSPVLFTLSMVLALVVLWFVADRVFFLMRAEHTTGSVATVIPQNGRCSCGRRCRYDCTRFQARVIFPEAQGTKPLWVSAGRARGYDRPVSYAMYAIGDDVPVVYNPRDTDQAYRDSFSDVWGTPLALLFFQIITFFGSFAQRRHPA
jgi:hypothetical protein